MLDDHSDSEDLTLVDLWFVPAVVVVVLAMAPFAWCEVRWAEWWRAR